MYKWLVFRRADGSGHISDLSEYMNISYKPNYKVAGKVFGSDMRDYASYLDNISDEDIDKFNNDNLVIVINDKEYRINKDLVDIKITSKEGFNIAVDNNDLIILDTNITEDLLCEGLARETVSKIQNLRKSIGYEIMDRIKINYSSNDEYSNRIEKYLDFIKKETLAISISRVDNIENIININDYEVGIEIEKDI